MSYNEKSLLIRLDTKDLQEALSKHIVDPYSKGGLINLIMTHLTKTEIISKRLVEVLLKGDISPLSFRVGDKVWVGWDYIPTWGHDYAQNVKDGWCRQGCLAGQITNVNKYEEYQYEVSFEVSPVSTKKNIITTTIRKELVISRTDIFDFLN